MRVFDGLGKRPDVAGGPLRRQGIGPGEFIQTAAGDVVHRVVRQAFVLAHFMDRHDVGMLEIGRRLGLGAETLQILVAGACRTGSNPDLSTHPQNRKCLEHFQGAGYFFPGSAARLHHQNNAIYQGGKGQGVSIEQKGKSKST